MILGLALWAVRLQSRAGALERELRRLAETVAALRAPDAAAPPVPEARTAILVTPSGDDPIALPPTPELDTPPEPVVVGEPIQPGGTDERPAAAPPRPSLSDWIAENGLAWLGGAALALGGAFLVAYAAQRGAFSPARRIWAALALGVLMMAAGEGVRRRREQPHALAAAAVSGAGAATLYAAIWAAHGLYRFIGASLAAPALAAVSLGLLGLATLHGEAVAVIAVGGAFAAPAITGSQSWPPATLDAYLLLVTATGAVVGARRGWRTATATTLALSGAWALARLSGDDPAGAAALALGAPLSLYLALELGRGARQAERAPERLLDAALAGAGVLLLALVASGGGGWPFAALAGALSLLAVQAGRRTLAHPLALLAPAAAIPVATYAQIVLESMSEGLRGAPERLAAIPLLIGAALWATQSVKMRPASAMAAIAAALSLTLGRETVGRTFQHLDALLFAAAAGALALGALAAARRSDDAGEDWAVAGWTAAAAEVVGLTLHAGLPALWEPPAYAALAFALALLSRRLPWRGLSEAGATAALVSFAALLGPAVAVAALRGTLGAAEIAATAGAAVLLQAAAWRLLAPARPRSADAVSTTAILSALLGVFLVLRVWTRGGGAGLDLYTEAALRSVLLLAAGLALATKGSATPFGRWRALAFLIAGGAHGLLLNGLALHPAFSSTVSIGGPPLLDGFALGLLAPALILGATVARPGALSAAARRGAAAASLAFFLLWAVSEVRRLFHGPRLRDGGWLHAETAAYAVVLLAASLGLAWLATRPAPDRERPAAPGFRLRAAESFTWAGGGVAAWLLLFAASPWWGPLQAPLRQPALLFAEKLAAVAVGSLIARRWREAGRAPLARAASAAAVMELFVLLTLSVRYAFRGTDMRPALAEAGLETWTFSAAWAVYGLGVMVLGVHRRDRLLQGLGVALLLGTTVKVLVFDMARLEGPVRAASFLVVGALLIVGALLARRLRARPSA